jgi:hypothetical protein
MIESDLPLFLLKLTKMDFKTYSHRHGEIIFQEANYIKAWNEIVSVITSITDDELIKKHEAYKGVMSLSKAINELLKEKFVEKGWRAESPIFQDSRYQGDKWRLDFAKVPVSIEVGFNHGEAIAWNLLKPVMASELNHIQKAIQTELSVVITATSELKEAGAFDSAVGEFEKYLDYLKPMSNQLTTPMVVIGLLPPKTFKLIKEKHAITGKNKGNIVYF